MVTAHLHRLPVLELFGHDIEEQTKIQAAALKERRWFAPENGVQCREALLAVEDKSVVFLVRLGPVAAVLRRAVRFPYQEVPGRIVFVDGINVGFHFRPGPDEAPLELR